MAVSVAAQAPGFARFAEALAGARFAVFLVSGRNLDGPELEMLLGHVADLNRKGRAAALFLPSSDSGWGATLASTWRTGFPLRTGFFRGYPEHDPWRFDAARMLADGEAVVDATGDADHHHVIDITAIEHPPCGAGGPGGAHPGHRRHDGCRARQSLVDPRPDRRRRRPQVQLLHQRPQLRSHRRQDRDSHHDTLPRRPGGRRPL